MSILNKKICQNCNQRFTIEPEDFAFYKKVNVPPPTWCPKCGALRTVSGAMCKK